jgi:predicted alpha-1,2-mannosidase
MRLRTLLPALAALTLMAKGPRLDLVNPLQGTASTYAFSHGNCLPLVGTPWANIDWSPQSDGDLRTPWFFHPETGKLVGFRATHQPSPWCQDYGQFMVMVQTGPRAAGPKDRASTYDPDRAKFRPDYVRMVLDRYQVTAELTASERCGVFRFTFAKGGPARILVDPARESHVEVHGRRITGWTTYHTGEAAGDYHLWFAGELDRDAAGAEDKGVALMEFEARPGEKVQFRVATSQISADQAERNLAESGGGFDAVRARTAAAWEKGLARVDVEGTPAQTRTFYTCLYRAMKFPHAMHEAGPGGKLIHYSPFDGRVHEGVGYTDSGLWDTFRTQFPFLSVVFPERFGEMVEGWLNAYREGGWLPQWPTPGGTHGMVGSHADAMVADALVKGIRGFDRDTAYAALRKDAFDIDPKGREQMASYLERGYVVDGTMDYSLSATLDFAYDDWCVAQAARLLGKTADCDILMKRAQNYRRMWDPAIGFMRPLDEKGAFAGTFDPYAWGGAYVEGGPWQCSWAVQHDAEGLAQLLGGRAGLARKLDQLFREDPIYKPGGYKGVIHEMREMAALGAGQWGQSNQPSFHHPYLFTSAGQPWKTEYWTRFGLDRFYNDGPRGYPGDEDNGSSASWYLLSALGFYPLTPGHPSYVLTSPLFRKATLHLAGGRTFTIDARGNDATTVYVNRRRLNGKPLTRTWLSHEEIVRGGTLVVTPSASPRIREIPEADLPYSASLKGR